MTQVEYYMILCTQEEYESLSLFERHIMFELSQLSNSQFL